MQKFQLTYADIQGKKAKRIMEDISLWYLLLSTCVFSATLITLALTQ